MLEVVKSDSSAVTAEHIRRDEPVDIGDGFGGGDSACIVPVAGDRGESIAVCRAEKRPARGVLVVDRTEGRSR